MFWITCSNQSTKPARKPCAKGSVLAGAAVLICAGLASPTAFAAKTTTLDVLATAAFAPMGVFQSLEFETNATTGMASWNKAKRKLSAETASYAACDAGTSKCPAQLREWRQRLAQWTNLSTRAKLILVNRFANSAIAYTDDRKAFHTADYWATPLESLRGRGDCEDYVLLKYASLRGLGFAEDQLRIVIVNDLKAGLGHAVLSVKTADGIFILDNQDNRVLRHDSILRYAPVYSVNAKGRWINIATRDLKKRKVAPVVLVASNAELENVLPASASPQASPKPILKKLRNLVEPQKPMTARLQAVAAISMLHQSISVAEREPDIPKPTPAPAVSHWARLIEPVKTLLASLSI